MLKLGKIEKVNDAEITDSGQVTSAAWQQVERGVYTLRYETPAEDPVEWGRDVSYLDDEFKEWQARAVAARSEHQNGETSHER